MAARKMVCYLTIESASLKFPNWTSLIISHQDRRSEPKTVQTIVASNFEQEAIYRFSFDQPKYLNFFNEGNVNNMGMNRGYRIDIRDMMKQLYPKDWGLVNGAAWSLNQITVTKRKDIEKQVHHFTISTVCMILLSTPNASFPTTNRS